jgi:hypothetical protein
MHWDLKQIYLEGCSLTENERIGDFDASDKWLNLTDRGGGEEIFGYAELF